MYWKTEARRLMETGYVMSWPTWPATWIVVRRGDEAYIIDVPLSEFPESEVVDARDYQGYDE